MIRNVPIAFCLGALLAIRAGSATGAVFDQVRLKGNGPDRTGMDIPCRVRETRDGKLWVIAIENGQPRGPMSIPLDRINRIEYDLEGRRAELPAGDFSARYRFALWELSLGRRAEAMLDLEAVAGQQGVPVEAFIQLGRLQEEAARLAAALGSFNAYLQAGPGSEELTREARAAVARIEPRVAALPPEQQNPEAPNKGPEPAGDADINAQPPAAQTPAVDEGLEIYPGGWNIVPWADPATIAMEKDEKTGNQFLAVHMGGDSKSSQRKTAIQLRVGRTKPAAITSPKLTFFIYCPVNFKPGEGTLPISVAFQTGRAMTYFESRTFHFNKKGWHTVTIDLNGDDFKSEATDWAYKTPLLDKNDLKSLIILVNTRRNMSIYLDYIKFTQ
jgi:hypothetical protein